jgi:hypothetical protein
MRASLPAKRRKNMPLQNLMSTDGYTPVASPYAVVTQPVGVSVNVQLTGVVVLALVLIAIGLSRSLGVEV